MKKITAIVVALAIITSFSSTAFAGGHHRGGGRYTQSYAWCGVENCSIYGTHNHGYHYGCGGHGYYY